MKKIYLLPICLVIATSLAALSGLVNPIDLHSFEDHLLGNTSQSTQQLNIEELQMNADSIPDSDKQFDLIPIGSFATGIFDEGAAEIVAHDPASQRAFFTNADANSVSVLDVQNPFAPTQINDIDMSTYGDGVNSVTINNGIVAVAVEAEAVDMAGSVVFFDTDGNFLNSVTAGFLPDMVTFTPDGNRVLVANEGEPNDDYTIDPEGSISIIDLSNGVENATVNNLTFEQFNGQEEELRAQGIRIFGPGASAAQDFEPEYITVTEDGAAAFVILQENNALAAVDLTTETITGVLPLGFKDHSLVSRGIDANNRVDSIDIRNWPVLGMYQPDAIKSVNIDGADYIVTANEGDARDYDGFSEEVRVEDLMLDSMAYPNANMLQMEEVLGRLRTTTATGDTDGDGDIDQIYSYGARSFSIWAADGSLVFDSGDHFEQKLAELAPENFNSNNDDNDSFKSRSDDKGPEPEAVEIVKLDGNVFALIGLERIGGVMVYEITDPTAPKFVSYTNNRNFDVPADSPEAGDLGVEDIKFITAENSPTGTPLVLTANEVSGTITVFAVNEVPDPVSTDDVLDLTAFEFVIGPNPISEFAMLNYNLPATSDVNITIYDMLARPIQTLVDSRQLAGQQSQQLNIGNLPAGIYNVRVEIDGKVNAVKIMKLN